ncbi:unnamed protein product, partial [Rhizoctonia solani]
PSGQYIAATQLWLLLYLCGDLSDDVRRRLMTRVNDRAGLHLKAKGLDQVKNDLENCIIEKYQEEHKIRGQMVNQESSYPTQDTFTFRFFVQHIGNKIQQSFLRLKYFLETDIEDIRAQENQGNYQRIYLARVVECILQTRGTQENEELLNGPYLGYQLELKPHLLLPLR